MFSPPPNNGGGRLGSGGNAEMFWSVLAGRSVITSVIKLSLKTAKDLYRVL